MDKIAMLSRILETNPQDAFARYGLAMEYAGRDDFGRALPEFATLLKDNPRYTPGYFMAAQTLAHAGKPEKAREHLRLGISSARAEGNGHAEREMQAMLEELELDA